MRLALPLTIKWCPPLRASAPHKGTYRAGRGIKTLLYKSITSGVQFLEGSNALQFDMKPRRVETWRDVHLWDQKKQIPKKVRE